MIGESAPESELFLPTNIKDEFLDLFYHLIKDRLLSNNNKLNVFTLGVKNNSFSYNELVEILGDRLHYFALSRAEVAKLKAEDKLRTLTDRAKHLLRNHLEKKKSGEVGDGEGGELGEILLYCLLESHLKSPKILTKLELKTSNQMYVNGADGVHLLKLNSKDYQLIFGESKLNADLKQGIYKSFGSLTKLLNNNGKKLEFEIDLVDSQLIKEAYDSHLYDFLKKIIFPSVKDDETYINYSFGIFLGFNIHLTEEEMKLSYPEFREHVKNKITAEIEESIESIEFQMKKSQFVGYQIYIYIIPFTDLDKNRIEIVEQLIN